MFKITFNLVEKSVSFCTDRRKKNLFHLIFFLSKNAIQEPGYLRFLIKYVNRNRMNNWKAVDSLLMCQPAMSFPLNSV